MKIVFIIYCSFIFFIFGLAFLHFQILIKEQTKHFDEKIDEQLKNISN